MHHRSVRTVEATRRVGRLRHHCWRVHSTRSVHALNADIAWSALWARGARRAGWALIVRVAVCKRYLACEWLKTLQIKALC